MRLHFVARSVYRRKTDPDTLAEVLRAADAEDAYVVPEGGSNAAAVRGCVELGRELAGTADVAAVACGTGGTLAGLAAGLGGSARTLGIPVLKGGFLTAEIRALQTAAFGGPRGEWSLDERFHHGGYARVPAGLEAFAADFEQRHGLPVERLYVAKLLHALVTLAGRAPSRAGARSPRWSPGGRSPDPARPGRDGLPRLPVGRGLLQVQPAQQRPQHLVVDVAPVAQLHEHLALGADHLPRQPPVGVVHRLPGDGVDLPEPLPDGVAAALQDTAQPVGQRRGKGVALVGEQVVEALLGDPGRLRLRVGLGEGLGLGVAAGQLQHPDQRRQGEALHDEGADDGGESQEEQQVPVREVLALRDDRDREGDGEDTTPRIPAHAMTNGAFQPGLRSRALTRAETSHGSQTAG